MGLLEGTNLSVGRGTDLPFELVGAPWIDPVPLADALNRLRLAGVRFDRNGTPAYFHPTESQSVFVGDKVVGRFGRIHPRRADALDVPRDTFLAELDLTALTKEHFLEQKFSGVPRYPAVYRDLSLVFAETVSWSSIALHLARRFDWVESVELFDVFKDDSLPAGHRSLAFSVTLRHPDRTLSDAESADLQAKIVADLQAVFKAAPRTVSPKPPQTA